MRRVPQGDGGRSTAVSPPAMSAEPPAPPSPIEHRLWRLEQCGRQMTAVVRATPLGLELLIAIDDELQWSRAYRVALAGELRVDADRKREEFKAKGWTTEGTEA